MPKRKQSCVCELCGAVFANVFNKKRHLINLHGVIFERKYPRSPTEADKTKNPTLLECRECGISFTSSKGCYTHKKNFHSDSFVSYRNRLINPKLNDITQYDFLKENLPPRLDYEVVKYEPNYCDIQDWYYAKVRFSCQDEIEVMIWKEEYEALNNANFRIIKIHQNEAGEIFYQARLRCDKAFRKKRSRNKTKPSPCLANITITLKKLVNNSNKAIVIIRNTHNHDINNFSLSKSISPAKDIREKFILMFRANRTVEEALALHKADLEAEYGEDYLLVSNDGALMPDAEYAYKLYDIIKNNESQNTNDIINALHSATINYNKSVGQEIAEFVLLSDDNFIIVITTPLMQRISTIKEAGEIMYVVTSQDFDRCGCKLYLFMVSSIAGALPVGAIFVSSDNQEILVFALEMYKNLLTKESFGGRGQKGPRLIMTNDSLPEREALSSVFDKATYLVCSFHVLQMTWQYICEEGTCINEADKQELFAWIKRIVYSESESEMNDIFEAFFTDPLPKKYSHFCEFVSNLQNEKLHWAICMKKDTIISDQSTHSICEIASQIKKEGIYKNVKAFSPLQLFEYIIKDMTAFYEKKLLAIASGKPDDYLKRKFDYLLERMPNMTWKQVAGLESSFEVTNNETETTYIVDTEVGVCSCTPGIFGLPCKHQIFIMYYVNQFSPQINLETPEEKLTIYYFITGKKLELYEYSDDLWQTVNLSQSNLVHNLNDNDASKQDATKNFNSLMKKFENISQDIIDRCMNSPSKFLPAVKTFIENYNKGIDSSSEMLLSSLKSFGKNLDISEITDFNEDYSSSAFSDIQEDTMTCDIQEDTMT